VGRDVGINRTAMQQCSAERHQEWVGERNPGQAGRLGQLGHHTAERRAAPHDWLGQERRRQGNGETKPQGLGLAATLRRDVQQLRH
jgi:hypothetical protein